MANIPLVPSAIPSDLVGTINALIAQVNALNSAVNSLLGYTSASPAYDTVVGAGAGVLLGAGAQLNTLIGGRAGIGVSTSSGNTAIGYLALGADTANNTAVGKWSLFTGGAGAQNTGLGYGSLFNVTAGGNNLAIGFGAGWISGISGSGVVANALTTGNYSTFLGFQSCYSTTTNYDYTTVVGAAAGAWPAANTVTLGRIGTDIVYSGPAVIGALSNAATYYTVAALPAASAALKGARAFVTDATAPTYNGTLTGGGAVIVPVFCTGAAWVSA